MNELSTFREEAKTKYSRYRHWEIFKILEAELLTISRYINITEDNFGTHSAELSALILRICTEIETLRKRITGANDNGAASEKLLALYPDIACIVIKLPLWALTFQPWKSLPDNKPEWWSAYESIKHDKLNCIVSGNLFSFLNSLSGLYAILLFYERFFFGHKNDKGVETVDFEQDILVSSYFMPQADNINYGRSFWTNNYFIQWQTEESSDTPEGA